MEGADMTTAAEVPWTFDAASLDLKPHTLSTRAARLTRAWDRVPQTSFAHKGRQVWKRAEPKLKSLLLGSEADAAEDEDQGEHGAKRQRLKQVPTVPKSIGTRRDYASTLRDQQMGTPKRKVSKRKSLRRSTFAKSDEIETLGGLSKRRSSRIPTSGGSPAADTPQIVSELGDIEAHDVEVHSETESHTSSQHEGVSEEKVFISGEHESESSVTSPEGAAADTTTVHQQQEEPEEYWKDDVSHPLISMDSDESSGIENGLPAEHKTPEPVECGSETSAESTEPGEQFGMVQDQYEDIIEAKDQDQNCRSNKVRDNVQVEQQGHEEVEIESEDEDEAHFDERVDCQAEFQEEETTTTIQEDSGQEETAHNAENNRRHPFTLDDILKKERPINTASPARSVESRRTSRRVSKRLSDTGRGISKQNNETPSKARSMELEEGTVHRVNNFASEDLAKKSDEEIRIEQSALKEQLSVKLSVPGLAVGDLGYGSPSETHQAATMPYEEFSDNDSLDRHTNFSPDTLSSLRARDLADRSLDEEQEQEEDQDNDQDQDFTVDIDHTVEANEPDELSYDSNDESKDGPPKRTRSGARFSDDTSILKDFLNRAQARKAAQALQPSTAPSIPLSPRRSPRKILGNLDSNSPSPTKSRDISTRPGTPPNKKSATADADDEVDETMTLDILAEPSSTTRRSGRTRLPALAKPAPGVTSFIPVRRGDGHEHVVLQRSEAQLLATATRTNTKRNRGQAQMPKYLLRAMAVNGDTTEEIDLTGKGAILSSKGKCVVWDEKLVYFQDEEAAPGEVKKKKEKPKVRRLKAPGEGLPSTNGTPVVKRKRVDLVPTESTPAPKQGKAVPPKQSTPGPKRRGRSKEVGVA